MDTYHVIGLMSGTSLDGLDIAFCRFQLSNYEWGYDILIAKTYHYNQKQIEKLNAAHTFSAIDLMRLDAEMANLFSNRVLEFISDNDLKPDFISSHGHTIFHQPKKSTDHKSDVPFTTQIGSGAIIAALTGLNVVSDFRSADVALGGQGAPLVPIGDKKLFSEFDYCINLGGIANISFDKINISNSGGDSECIRIASDLCFVNMALNYLAAEKRVNYDEGGVLARNGEVNINLLNKLNDLEFCKRPFPKSIGKEYFESEVAPIFDELTIPVEDKLRTCCEHISLQILDAVNSSKNAKARKPKILITGGGAYNLFLMELLKQNIPAETIIPENKLVEFKEALIFAFLGILRIRNEINVLGSVTGAKQSSCSGAIYNGKNNLA